LFGYIKPFKPEMKMAEFEVYQSAYCGLCRALGKEFGPFARLTLSYDYAFAAVFKMALTDSGFCGFEKGRCLVNPLKKKVFCRPNADIDFIANIAMLMMYYKLKDDIADSGFLKKLKYFIALPFVALAKNRAARRYPVIDRAIARCMDRQAGIEQEGVSSIDLAADPTAQALSVIFAEFSGNEKQKAALSRFGYLLGRWIYIIDALDDLEDDLKEKNYNPFLLSPTQDLDAVRKNAEGVLNLTAGEISNAYVLIDFGKFKPILDNVIYLGLPVMLKNVNNPQRSRKK